MMDECVCVYRCIHIERNRDIVVVIITNKPEEEEEASNFLCINK